MRIKVFVSGGGNQLDGVLLMAVGVVVENIERSLCLVLVTDIDLKETHPLFKELLKAGRVGTSAAKALLIAADTYPEKEPEDKEKRAKRRIQELLVNYVLAAHSDGTYTFHSRVVKTLFRQANASAG